jgi:hypothetical protein
MCVGSTFSWILCLVYLSFSQVYVCLPFMSKVLFFAIVSVNFLAFYVRDTKETFVLSMNLYFSVTVVLKIYTFYYPCLVTFCRENLVCCSYSCMIRTQVLQNITNMYTNLQSEIVKVILFCYLCVVIDLHYWKLLMNWYISYIAYFKVAHPHCVV